MLTDRIWLKIAVTLLAVVAAPAIARSRLILVPREVLNDPVALARYRAMLALILRIAAITVLVCSLAYQRFIVMAR